MAMTDAQRRAREKWEEKIGEIKFRVPKDKKEQIQAHALNMGESVNAFISRAVDEAMVRDAEK